MRSLEAIRPSHILTLFTVSVIACSAVLVVGQVPEKTPPAILTVELSLEGNAKAEVTVTLERDKMLRKTLPGTVRVDLTAAGNGRHHLFFQCPGYASQWVYVACADGELSQDKVKVELCRKRYVILRCAFNTKYGRTLEGNDVEVQRVALSHWTGPNHFNLDWQIWQKSSGAAMFGDTPYLEFHRYCQGFGFTRPAPGISYEAMKESPKSGYKCENIKAEKGLVLYCRVNGDVPKTGQGYGKLLVEAITETPPKDISILDGP